MTRSLEGGHTLRELPLFYVIDHSISTPRELHAYSSVPEFVREVAFDRTLISDRASTFCRPLTTPEVSNAYAFPRANSYQTA